MYIDWLNFTPAMSFWGGILIGLAAVILILFCGRIAGISGITAGLLVRGASDRIWRVAFLLGMILAPILYSALYELPKMTVLASWPAIIIAGLLVGMGTRIGSGCTSGHGVCGLSRLSKRSLAATLTFMTVGFITATLIGYWS